MNLEKLSDTDLHLKTLETSMKEKEMTLVLLYHLREVERRKLYAERGYASLWEYVQKGLSYSESQTHERISAMRLMARDQKAQEALESGTLSLTQAAQTERFLRAQEKSAPVAKEEVQSLLLEVQGRSKRETEKILLSHQRTESPVPRERIRQVTKDFAQITFPVTEEMQQAMERYWELKGRCSATELFSTCLMFFLEQKDPAKIQEKKKHTNENSMKTRALPVKVKQSRYISKAVKREVQGRSKGQCEYVDPESNRRCQSKYLLQFDHIHPHAWGGDEWEDNIRLLCAVHNQFLGEKMFAKEAGVEAPGSLS